MTIDHPKLIYPLNLRAKMRDVVLKPNREMNHRPTWILSLSNLLTTVLIATAIFASSSVMAQDGEGSIFTGGDMAKGETLFNNNCASCHYPTGDVLAAPGLEGIDERWEGKEELIVTWIQNPNDAINTGDQYVNSMVAEYKPRFGMMQAQAVSKEDIKHILTYALEGDHGADEEVVAGGEDWYAWDDDYSTEDDEESSYGIWFLILGIIFLIIALSAAGIRRQIQTYMHQQKTGESLESEGYFVRFKKWAWKNRVSVSLVGMFITVFVLVLAYQAAMEIGVYTGYRPEQPIKFSHKLHAGKNKIDCQYCHHSASKSKHAGIPSVNICMNCHTGIKKGNDEEATAEIQKIYDAIGFDPEMGAYIEDYEEKPVKWVKVHNLPDLAYFNHSQHVEVANLECQNCHGPVETYTVGRVSSVEDNNKTKGAIELSKPTLTMGWCIECHNKASVQVAGSDNGYYQEIHDRLVDSERGREELRKYLEDEKITVRELGGWECAKCHY